MHNYDDIQVIIMAGGIGSRFWPMSTPDYPKHLRRGQKSRYQGHDRWSRTRSTYRYTL